MWFSGLSIFFRGIQSVGRIQTADHGDDFMVRRKGLISVPHYHICYKSCLLCTQHDFICCADSSD